MLVPPHYERAAPSANHMQDQLYLQCHPALYQRSNLENLWKLVTLIQVTWALESPLEAVANISK